MSALYFAMTFKAETKHRDGPNGMPQEPSSRKVAHQSKCSMKADTPVKTIRGPMGTYYMHNQATALQHFYTMFMSVFLSNLTP